MFPNARTGLHGVVVTFFVAVATIVACGGRTDTPGTDVGPDAADEAALGADARRGVSSSG